MINQSNNIVTIKIETPEALINKMQEFEDLATADTYIFRGQSNAQWSLTPSAFREENIRKAWDQFPIDKEIILQEWIGVDGVRFMNQTMPNLNQKLTAQNYSKLILFHNYQPIPLARFFNHCLFLMAYNYSLSQFHLEYNHYFSEEYLKTFHHTAEYWIDRVTFSRFLQTVDLLYDCYEPNSTKLINRPYIFEAITGYDETLPQHYGADTTVLDWSYNPFIALYFAINHIIDAEDNFSITKEFHHYFSIFKYRQLDFSENALVQISAPHQLLENERAEKQKGIFTYIPKVNQFYLLNGEHPTIENYLDSNNNFFELEKYVVKVNKDMIDCARDLLKMRSLNKKTLALDKIVENTKS